MDPILDSGRSWERPTWMNIPMHVRLKSPNGALEKKARSNRSKRAVEPFLAEKEKYEGVSKNRGKTAKWMVKNC